MFSNLGKSGKPNPINHEFTVLAGLVEYDKNGINEPNVICLTTGTKCFPKNISNYTENIVDCHAESLLKRAFKRHLIGVIDNWLENKQQINSIDEFYNEGYLFEIKLNPNKLFLIVFSLCE